MLVITSLDEFIKQVKLGEKNRDQKPVEIQFYREIDQKPQTYMIPKNLKRWQLMRETLAPMWDSIIRLDVYGSYFDESTQKEHPQFIFSVDLENNRELKKSRGEILQGDASLTEHTITPEEGLLIQFDKIMKSHWEHERELLRIQSENHEAILIQLMDVIDTQVTHNLELSEQYIEMATKYSTQIIQTAEVQRSAMLQDNERDGLLNGLLSAAMPGIVQTMTQSQQPAGTAPAGLGTQPTAPTADLSQIMNIIDQFGGVESLKSIFAGEPETTINPDIIPGETEQ